MFDGGSFSTASFSSVSFDFGVVAPVAVAPSGGMNPAVLRRLLREIARRRDDDETVLFLTDLL